MSILTDHIHPITSIKFESYDINYVGSERKRVAIYDMQRYYLYKKEVLVNSIRSEVELQEREKESTQVTSRLRRCSADLRHLLPIN